jgi:hypothetical protein
METLVKFCVDTGRVICTLTAVPTMEELEFFTIGKGAEDQLLVVAAQGEVARNVVAIVLQNWPWMMPEERHLEKPPPHATAIFHCGVLWWGSETDFGVVMGSSDALEVN